MSFSRLFPAATWLWRRITSRPARLLYLGVLVMVIVPGIALRVEAALFERRVLKVMSVLSSLRIGVTPKAEVLSRMVGFTVNEHYRNKSDCDADECLWVGVSSPRLSDWTLRKAGWSGHDNLYLVLSWWGFRLRSLGADVNLNSDKVSSFGYQLILSTAHPDYPGAIVINAGSIGPISRPGRLNGDPITDESPHYKVIHNFRWPATNTNVYFTPHATPELLSHAFGLKLQCILSITGCRTANQLLPEAEQDRLRIERTANERMNGPNQCPDWILPDRARDTEDILLVEVKNSGPAFVANDDGSHYRRANFRLLRVLKGKPGRPLDNVVVASETWIGVHAHNSAFDLLNPGQKLLLFSNGKFDSYASCEEVAATESAIQTIERALGTAKP
jgi:hypothetical protein